MIHPYRLIARIFIDPSGCWIWTGARSREGYGQVWHRGRVLYVHRLAWELANGCPAPSLPSMILHARECVSRACCNPDHLRVGTHVENMLDAVALGRRFVPPASAMPRGDQHWTRRPESADSRRRIGEAKRRWWATRPAAGRRRTGGARRRRRGASRR